MRYLLLAKTDAEFRESRSKIGKIYGMMPITFTQLVRIDQIASRHEDMVVLCGKWYEREDIVEMLKNIFITGLTVVKEEEVL